MATRRLRPSLVSLSVVLILVVVSVVGFGLTRRNNDQQEQALLQSNTSQAAAFASQGILGPCDIAQFGRRHGDVHERIPDRL